MTCIPIRCRICGLVRVDGDWYDYAQPQCGEVEGICPHCMVTVQANRQLGRNLADRRARDERRRGKKFGPSRPGEDVFR